MYNYIVIITGDIMRHKRYLALILIITVLFCYGIDSLSSSIIASKNRFQPFTPTIVIDAGHGGKDAGAIGYAGNSEKDINLAIALALYDCLRVAGIDSKLVRTGDYELYNPGEKRIRSDLYNRLDYVNSIPNSILVSIHQNHYENSAEWGSQVWYSANTEQSKELADSVQRYIKEYLQNNNTRSNKESDDSYYILYKATVPSIMVECGFISNKKENELLQSCDYQKKMAYSIFVGISKEI